MQIHYEPLKTKRHLEPAQIYEHLANVAYIVMAAPAVRDEAKGPIHFTFFLNTPELPKEAVQPVLEKFAVEYGIRDIEERFAQTAPVAFAETAQSTPMPMLLWKPEDRMRLPSTTMFVMDFEADSDDFPEVKNDQLTGWTYVYE